MNMQVLTPRLLRVLRFDASVYKEIAADASAMPQAGIIVTVAAVLAALGQYLPRGIVAIIVAAVLAIIGFFIYVAIATGVAKVFGGKTGFNEMGRTLGYAYAWYALGILALIPFGGGLLVWIGSIVAWIAGTIALRESAEFETWKAFVTVVVAGLVVAFIIALVTLPLFAILGLAAAQAQ
jgi:hypothetical protein